METSTKNTVNNFTHFEKIIIDNIDFDTYGYSNDCYLYDKIKTCFNIFKSEYVHVNNQNQSLKKLFAEWLQGLPSVLTVPFYYNEILENAENAGIKVKDEDKFCQDYWENLANAFFTLKDNL